MNKLYASFGKRALDTVVAGSVGLLTLPAAVAAAILVRMEDGQRALFRQRRLGRGGEEFTILKLRSMAVDAPTVSSAEAAAPPITRVGRYLRRTNVDEVPQLWNVVRGEMSLVGPRPALPSQRSLLDLRAASGAMNVRPGLTGLAQVNAYDGMSDEEKARWDAEYAASVSLRRDMSIIAKTFVYLLKPPPRY